LLSSLIFAALLPAQFQMLLTPPKVKACTTRGSGCSPVVTTDPYSKPGGFAGYADPSMRQDPQTGRYWKAYTWPHTINPGAIQVSDIHLDYSDDGGATWTYKGALYTSQLVTDPVAGRGQDWTSHEVITLTNWVSKGVTNWGAWHEHFSVTAATGHLKLSESKRWLFATTSDPTGLNGPFGLTAPINSAYIGVPATNVCTGCKAGPTGSWPYTVNLASLSSDLSGCQEFWEPWLNTSGGVMALGIQCQSQGGALTFYGKLTTALSTTGPFNWTYQSGGATHTPFVSMADATELCRAVASASWCASNSVNLTQMDVRQDGAVAVASVVFYAPAKSLVGWVVLPLASISPPAFVRSGGHIKVLAAVTSPDSFGTGGGSCTVAPGVPLICAHKVTGGNPGTTGCSAYGPCDNGMGSSSAGVFTFLMNTRIRF